MKGYLETLTPILRSVGELVLQLRAEGLHTELKPDGTIVSNADKAASDVLIAAIAAAYPGDGIVSEEDPDVSGLHAARTWVIDPIDGTKHYTKGGEMFCIMVALYDTHPEFSIIYYPVLNQWYWAERGKGAFVKRRGKVKALHVLPPHDPPRIIHGAECKHAVGEEGTKGIMKYFGKILHGKLDCFLRSDVPYWDLCPPLMILTEAGGVTVDFSGKPLTYGHVNAIQPEIVAGHPVAVAYALEKISVERKK